eukprot:scaffold198483_cov31-Tisochrysis_lutea.AAC.2
MYDRWLGFLLFAFWGLGFGRSNGSSALRRKWQLRSMPRGVAGSRGSESSAGNRTLVLSPPWLITAAAVIHFHRTHDADVLGLAVRVGTAIRPTSTMGVELRVE